MVGSLLGTAIGLAFCGVVDYCKIPMPGQLMNVREIPVELSARIVALTAATAVAVSMAAALAPAWRADGLNPVEALRAE